MTRFIEVEPNEEVELADHASEFRSLPMCPECGGSLVWWVEAWGDDGEPHEVRVDCQNEDTEDDDTAHRWWQGEWQPVLDVVETWARRRVRVKESAR